MKTENECVTAHVLKREHSGRPPSEKKKSFRHTHGAYRFMNRVKPDFATTFVRKYRALSSSCFRMGLCGLRSHSRCAREKIWGDFEAERPPKSDSTTGFEECKSSKDGNKTLLVRHREASAAIHPTSVLIVFRI